MRAVLLILMLGGLVLALPGSAQDQDAGQAPPAGETAETPAPEPADEAPDEAEPGTGSADEAETEEVDDIDDFIFSEEIPAETQLVFPVDI